MSDTKEMIRVPYGMTVHGEAEIEAVVNVLRTSTQMGYHVREMERRIAELYDKSYGIMLNSGSSANYLGVELDESTRRKRGDHSCPNLLNNRCSFEFGTS